MISPDKLFGNIFNDVHITPARLLSCSSDSLNRFIAAGNGKQPAIGKPADAPANPFQPIIDRLQPAVQALQQQSGNVDVSLSVQKGTTLTNDQVMDAFKIIMSEQEGVIANKVGGFKSIGYLQFYPHGEN